MTLTLIMKNQLGLQLSWKLPQKMYDLDIDHEKSARIAVVMETASEDYDLGIDHNYNTARVAVVLRSSVTLTLIIKFTSSVSVVMETITEDL